MHPTAGASKKRRREDEPSVTDGAGDSGALQAGSLSVTGDAASARAAKIPRLTSSDAAALTTVSATRTDGVAASSSWDIFDAAAPAADQERAWRLARYASGAALASSLIGRQIRVFYAKKVSGKARGVAKTAGSSTEEGAAGAAALATDAAADSSGADALTATLSLAGRAKSREAASLLGVMLDPTSSFSLVGPGAGTWYPGRVIDAFVTGMPALQYDRLAAGANSAAVGAAVSALGPAFTGSATPPAALAVLLGSLSRTGASGAVASASIPPGLVFVQVQYGDKSTEWVRLDDPCTEGVAGATSLAAATTLANSGGMETSDVVPPSASAETAAAAPLVAAASATAARLCTSSAVGAALCGFSPILYSLSTRNVWCRVKPFPWWPASQQLVSAAALGAPSLPYPPVWSRGTADVRFLGDDADSVERLGILDLRPLTGADRGLALVPAAGAGAAAVAAGAEGAASSPTALVASSGSANEAPPLSTLRAVGWAPPDWRTAGVTPEVLAATVGGGASNPAPVLLEGDTAAASSSADAAVKKGGRGVSAAGVKSKSMRDQLEAGLQSGAAESGRVARIAGPWWRRLNALLAITDAGTGFELPSHPIASSSSSAAAMADDDDEAAAAPAAPLIVPLTFDGLPLPHVGTANALDLPAVLASGAGGKGAAAKRVKAAGPSNETSQTPSDTFALLDDTWVGRWVLWQDYSYAADDTGAVTAGSAPIGAPAASPRRVEFASRLLAAAEAAVWTKASATLPPPPGFDDGLPPCVLRSLQSQAGVAAATATAAAVVDAAASAVASLCSGANSTDKASGGAGSLVTPPSHTGRWVLGWVVAQRPTAAGGQAWVSFETPAVVAMPATARGRLEAVLDAWEPADGTRLVRGAWVDLSRVGAVMLPLPSALHLAAAVKAAPGAESEPYCSMCFGPATAARPLLVCSDAQCATRRTGLPSATHATCSNWRLGPDATVPAALTCFTAGRGAGGLLDAGAAAALLPRSVVGELSGLPGSGTEAVGLKAFAASGSSATVFPHCYQSEWTCPSCRCCSACGAHTPEGRPALPPPVPTAASDTVEAGEGGAAAPPPPPTALVVAPPPAPAPPAPTSAVAGYAARGARHIPLPAAPPGLGTGVVTKTTPTASASAASASSDTPAPAALSFSASWALHSYVPVPGSHVYNQRRQWALQQAARATGSADLSGGNATMGARAPLSQRLLSEPPATPVSLLLCGPCGERLSNGHFCPVCHDAYRDDEIEMLCCDSCDAWLHCRCDGLTAADLPLIESKAHPAWGRSYICPVCRHATMIRLIGALRQEDKAGYFTLPVTPEQAPGYHNVIKRPMDLWTMARSLDIGLYDRPGKEGIQLFRDHFELIARNALVFNTAQDKVYKDALRYLRTGTSLFASQLPMTTECVALKAELDGLRLAQKDPRYVGEGGSLVLAAMGVAASDAAPDASPVTSPTAAAASAAAAASSAAAAAVAAPSTSMTPVPSGTAAVPLAVDTALPAPAAASDAPAVNAAAATPTAAGSVPLPADAAAAAAAGTAAEASTTAPSRSSGSTKAAKAAAPPPRPTVATSAGSPCTELIPYDALSPQHRKEAAERSRAAGPGPHHPLLQKAPLAATLPLRLPAAVAEAMSRTDLCGICSGPPGGAPRLMLACMDCGECFHAVCVVPSLLLRHLVAAARCYGFDPAALGLLGADGQPLPALPAVLFAALPHANLPFNFNTAIGLAPAPLALARLLSSPVLSESLSVVAQRWRCSSCRVCEVCGLHRADFNAQAVAATAPLRCLLVCDWCGGGAHAQCLSPPPVNHVRALMAAGLSPAAAAEKQSPLFAACGSRWFCGACVVCVDCCRGQDDATLQPLGRRRWSVVRDRCVPCLEVSQLPLVQASAGLPTSLTLQPPRAPAAVPVLPEGAPPLPTLSLAITALETLAALLHSNNQNWGRHSPLLTHWGITLNDLSMGTVLRLRLGDTLKALLGTGGGSNGSSSAVPAGLLLAAGVGGDAAAGGAARASASGSSKKSSSKGGSRAAGAKDVKVVEVSPLCPVCYQLSDIPMAVPPRLLHPGSTTASSSSSDPLVSDKMTCCDLCDRWVHLPCDAVAWSQYTQGAAGELDPSFPYICPACRDYMTSEPARMAKRLRSGMVAGIKATPFVFARLLARHAQATRTTLAAAKAKARRAAALTAVARDTLKTVNTSLPLPHAPVPGSVPAAPPQQATGLPGEATTPLSFQECLRHASSIFSVARKEAVDAAARNQAARPGAPGPAPVSAASHPVLTQTVTTLLRQSEPLAALPAGQFSRPAWCSDFPSLATILASGAEGPSPLLPPALSAGALPAPAAVAPGASPASMSALTGRAARFFRSSAYTSPLIAARKSRRALATFVTSRDPLVPAPGITDQPILVLQSQSARKSQQRPADPLSVGALVEAGKVDTMLAPAGVALAAALGVLVPDPAAVAEARAALAAAEAKARAVAEGQAAAVAAATADGAPSAGAAESEGDEEEDDPMTGDVKGEVGGSSTAAAAVDSMPPPVAPADAPPMVQTATVLGSAMSPLASTSAAPVEAKPDVKPKPARRSSAAATAGAPRSRAGRPRKSRTAVVVADTLVPALEAGLSARAGVPLFVPARILPGMGEGSGLPPYRRRAAPEADALRLLLMVPGAAALLSVLVPHMDPSLCASMPFLRSRRAACVMRAALGRSYHRVTAPLWAAAASLDKAVTAEVTAAAAVACVPALAPVPAASPSVSGGLAGTKRPREEEGPEGEEGASVVDAAEAATVPSAAVTVEAVEDATPAAAPAVTAPSGMVDDEPQGEGAASAAASSAPASTTAAVVATPASVALSATASVGASTPKRRKLDDGAAPAETGTDVSSSSSFPLTVNAPLSDCMLADTVRSVMPSVAASATAALVHRAMVAAAAPAAQLLALTPLQEGGARCCLCGQVSFAGDVAAVLAAVMRAAEASGMARRLPRNGRGTSFFPLQDVLTRAGLLQAGEGGAASEAAASEGVSSGAASAASLPRGSPAPPLSPPGSSRRAAAVSASVATAALSKGSSVQSAPHATSLPPPVPVSPKAPGIEGSLLPLPLTPRKLLAFAVSSAERGGRRGEAGRADAFVPAVAAALLEACGADAAVPGSVAAAAELLHGACASITSHLWVHGACLLSSSTSVNPRYSIPASSSSNATGPATAGAAGGATSASMPHLPCGMPPSKLLIHGAEKALVSALSTHCDHCGHLGATLRCDENSCYRAYHLRCAIVSGARLPLLGLAGRHNGCFCVLHAQQALAPVEPGAFPSGVDVVDALDATATATTTEAAEVKATVMALGLTTAALSAVPVEISVVAPAAEAEEGTNGTCVEVGVLPPAPPAPVQLAIAEESGMPLAPAPVKVAAWGSSATSAAAAPANVAEAAALAAGAAEEGRLVAVPVAAAEVGTAAAEAAALVAAAAAPATVTAPAVPLTPAARESTLAAALPLGLHATALPKEGGSTPFTAPVALLPESARGPPTLEGSWDGTSGFPRVAAPAPPSSALSVEPLPRHSPHLTLRVGALTVLRWGRLVTRRPGFSTSVYLVPVGYAARRLWWGPHPATPGKLARVPYRIDVVDAPTPTADHGPAAARATRGGSGSTLAALFVITSEVDPTLRVSAHCPDAAFTALRQAVVARLGHAVAGHLLPPPEAAAIAETAGEASAVVGCPLDEGTGRRPRLRWPASAGRPGCTALSGWLWTGLALPPIHAALETLPEAPLMHITPPGTSSFWPRYEFSYAIPTPAALADARMRRQFVAALFGVPVTKSGVPAAIYSGWPLPGAGAVSPATVTAQAALLAATGGSTAAVPPFLPPGVIEEDAGDGCVRCVPYDRTARQVHGKRRALLASVAPGALDNPELAEVDRVAMGAGTAIGDGDWEGPDCAGLILPGELARAGSEAVEGEGGDGSGEGGGAGGAAGGAGGEGGGEEAGSGNSGGAGGSGVTDVSPTSGSATSPTVASASSSSAGASTEAASASSSSVAPSSSSSSSSTDSSEGAHLSETKLVTMYRALRASVPSMSNRVVVRRSPIHGWGLFLRSDVPRDSMVIEYTGQLVREPVANRREIVYEEVYRVGRGMSRGAAGMLGLPGPRGAINDGSLLPVPASWPGSEPALAAGDAAGGNDAPWPLGPLSPDPRRADPLTLQELPLGGRVSDGSGGCYLFRLDEERIVDATYRGSAARFMNHCCDPNCYSKVITVDGEKKIVILAMRDLKRGEEVTYNYKFAIETDPKLKIPCYCGAATCPGTMN